MTIPPPFNLKLTDSHSRGPWYFTLVSRPSVSWLNQDQFAIVLNAEGRKIGEFDQQVTWDGGRGGERFSDDPTKYKDSKEAATWIPNHLFQSLQWQIAAGYRDAEMSLVGSKYWRGAFGSHRYYSAKITASATSNRTNAWVWLRRVGNPGTGTLELQTDGAGKPTGTALKSATVTTTNVTDIISVLRGFSWTAQAVTSTTVYHLVFYGASTDNAQNHWEIAGSSGGTNSFYKSAQFASDGTQADISVYYRLTDAEIVRRWWFFQYGADYYKVSNEATTLLYKWNETTDLWEIVTGHGLTTVTDRPVQVNGFMYFPCGDTTAIRVFNGTSWDAQTIALGQGCATGLALGFSRADGSSQIWRYNNALVSGGTTTGKAKTVSWAPAVAAYTTDLAFGTSIAVGDTTTAITGITAVNNTLWVRKTDAVGTVDNDRYTELDFGVRNTPAANNGIALVSWNGSVYFNWLFSTTRHFGGTFDDVGQGFKGNSFPDGRDGVDSAYTTYIAWMFVAKDGGSDGDSAIMLYDGLNWHEFSRGWAAGRRIQDVYIQPAPQPATGYVRGGVPTRLWFDCGGDSVFIEMPFNKGNPLLDPLVKYMHEFVVVSSEIDMGTAARLPKFIQDLTMISNNLTGTASSSLTGVGRRVELDYQIDEKVGTDEWVTPRKPFDISPEDTVEINEGNIRKFAYRLRGQTDNQLIPTDVRSIAPNGFARSPMLRILECTANVKTTTVAGKVQSAAKVMEWLENAASSAYLIDVESAYESFNDFRALIAPPNIYPIRANPEQNQITFTLLVLSTPVVL